MQWCGFVAGPLLTVAIPSLSWEHGVHPLFVWCQTEANLFITQPAGGHFSSMLIGSFQAPRWGNGNSLFTPSFIKVHQGYLHQQFQQMAISPSNTLHPPPPNPQNRTNCGKHKWTERCVWVCRLVKVRTRAFPVYLYPYIWFNIHECTWLAQQVRKCWVRCMLRRRCSTWL